MPHTFLKKKTLSISNIVSSFLVNYDFNNKIQINDYQVNLFVMQARFFYYKLILVRCQHLCFNYGIILNYAKILYYYM